MKMVWVAVFAVGLLSGVAHGQKVTGMCKDGKTTVEISREDACHGHKGVRTWYTDSAVPAFPVATRMSSFASMPVATKEAQVGSIPVPVRVTSTPSLAVPVVVGTRGR